MLIILVCLFLVPFILIIIGDMGYTFGPLYTFSITNIKDFFMFWISLFGVFGVVYNISQNQKRITQQEKQLQAQTISENNTRFAKGVELLGNSQESTRIGGIYTLFFLAKEFQSDYKECIFKILCSHITTITQDITYQKNHMDIPSNEIQTILNLLFKKTDHVYLFADYSASLWNAHLNGANLSFAYLKKIHLNHVSLDKAIMYHCDLQGAKIKYTNMRDSRLVHANLLQAEILYSHLNCTDLHKAQLDNATLQDTNLSHSLFKETSMISTRFVNTNLSCASITDTELSYSSIVDSDFFATEIINTNLSKAHIQNVSLEESNIDKSDLTSTQFIRCNLTNTNITSSKLKSTYFFKSNLQNITFKDSNKDESKFII